MADNDDLMIEVTGSSDKAASALDKVIAKVTQMQGAIEKVTPSLNKFTERLNSITSGSKAFALIEKLTKGAGDLTQAGKKAESAEAMYQARLDRANVSMERSRQQLDKLAAAKEKLASIDESQAKNSAAFSMAPEEFQKKYGSNTSAPVTGSERYTAPTSTKSPSINYDPAKIEAAIDAVTAQIKSKHPKIDIDTSEATQQIRQIGEYIDSLTPQISMMSESAQAQFNAIAEKLNLVSQQIDNQRMLYRSLADQAARVAQEQGEGSTAYLQLEKRMLSAASATQRLSETQTKLKSELAGVASESGKAGVEMAAAGEKSERAGKKSTSAWSGTMGMFRNMLIRIAAFRIFSAISQGVVTGIQNMALASSQASAIMSQLSTSTLYLKNSLAAALMPVLGAITPVIVQVIDALAELNNRIAIFIAQITHQKTVTIAKRSFVGYAKTINQSGNDAEQTAQKEAAAQEKAAKKAADAQEKAAKKQEAAEERAQKAISEHQKKIDALKKSIMGFDELNVLTAKADTWEAPKVPDYMSSLPAYSYTPPKWNGMPAPKSMFETIKTPSLSGLDNLQNKIKGFFDMLQNKTNLVKGQFEKATAQADAFVKLLDKIKLPVFGPWKVPAFPKVTIPALDLGAWNKSKNEYQQPVRAPAFLSAIAPTIILNGFLESKVNYQTTVAPPVVTAVTAPAIVLGTLFYPSIQAAGQKIRDFSTSTQAVVSAWGANVSDNFGKTWNSVSTSTGTALSNVKSRISQYGSATSSAFARVGNNIMANMRTTFSYIPTAVSSGLNAAGNGISTWLTSTSKGFANFGSNIVFNIGKSMESWYSNFVGGLSAAWKQFTDFMSGVGKNIGNWWDANKSWAAPTATAIGLAALNVGIAVATAGTSIPAQAALAGATGLATGGLVTAPILSLIGEGKDHEAVLPLNDTIYSRIGKGIRKNDESTGRSSESIDTGKIIKHLDALADAIQNMKLALYTDDRTIAESANRGNAQISKRYHRIITG